MGQASSTVTRRFVLLTEFEHRVDVERPQRAQIDDFGLDALLRQVLGRLQRISEPARIGDDGHVGAGARDARLADGEHEVGELRHLEALAVQDLVLEEHHRVGIADRGLEQPLGVGGGIGRDHLQPRHARIPGGEILAVLGGDAGGGAVRSAEHDGAMHLAARHIARLGGGIDDLVDRLHGEVPGHEFDDGLEAGEGRAHADAGEAMFGDGRVDDARRPRTPRAGPGSLCRRPDIGRPPRP